MVLDVMLPDTDGFEVVRRLLRDGCSVPVIFLTARDTQADKVAGLPEDAPQEHGQPWSRATAAQVR